MQRHRYTVGIDPHKHVHHAAVIDERGAEVATRPFSADTSGQAQLIALGARTRRDRPVGH